MSSISIFSSLNINSFSPVLFRSTLIRDPAGGLCRFEKGNEYGSNASGAMSVAWFGQLIGQEGVSVVKGKWIRDAACRNVVSRQVDS